MKEGMIQKKIYYHDTDCGGVVYYSNYLKFLEEGRTEFCAANGIDLQEWFNKGTLFVVVHVEVDYKYPARYGDVVKLATQVEKLGNSSIHFSQNITLNDKTVIVSKTIWACIDKDFKPRIIPQEIRQILEPASS
ncbi:MAG: thioesterase family protein [Candidatus Omnitrophica bacterium]|nr:thioesterase family protein [Candidatus Omnitrophota bacterium]HOX55062.1 thioesterase family protein [Candidatus Omnitrophota bacterium]